MSLCAHYYAQTIITTINKPDSLVDAKRLTWYKILLEVHLRFERRLGMITMVEMRKVVIFKNRSQLTQQMTAVALR